MRLPLPQFRITAPTRFSGGLRAKPAAQRHSMAEHSSKVVSFQLSRSPSDKDEPRLGRLTFQGRTPIQTPHYVAVSSRGAVPHLSQDMTRDNTSIRAIYTAVEDCELLVTFPEISSNVLTGELLLEPASYREGFPSITSPTSFQLPSPSRRIAFAKIHRTSETDAAYSWRSKSAAITVPSLEYI